MLKMSIEAPWYTYRKKLNALFERDPDIEVGEVYETDDGPYDYAVGIGIRNHEKFLALDRVLPKVRQYGKVVLGIVLFDEENENEEDDDIEIYETIFKGNPIVKDIKRMVDRAGVTHGYVRFQPEVIQFPDDDTSDYNGNWSGLAQDIAREAFAGDYRGVSFCTADIRENGDEGSDSLKDGDEDCENCNVKG